MQSLQGFLSSPLIKPDEGIFKNNGSTQLKKQNSTNISGALTPREGNNSVFKPKMAQPVVLVNDQSPKSNNRVTPKGNVLESLINQVRNQLNNNGATGSNTPNYRDRQNSNASGIITPHSQFGGNSQLNISQIT